MDKGNQLAHSILQNDSLRRRTKRGKTKRISNGNRHWILHKCVDSLGRLVEKKKKKEGRVSTSFIADDFKT